MSDSVALQNKEKELKKLHTMKLIRTLLPVVGLVLIFILFYFLTDGKIWTKLSLSLS